MIEDEAMFLYGFIVGFGTPTMIHAYGAATSGALRPGGRRSISTRATMALTAVAAISAVAAFDLIPGRNPYMDRSDYALGLAIMIGLSIMTTSVSAFIADGKARVWRARPEIFRLLRDDVPLRTDMQSEELIKITRRHDGEIKVSRHVSAETLEAIEEIIRRHGCGHLTEFEILVHALPKSATLRAAIAASGSDPMKSKYAMIVGML